MPNLEKKQVERLKQLLTLLEPDQLTKAEFVSAFENVVNNVLKLKQQNVQEMDALKSAIETVKKTLGDVNAKDFDSLRSSLKTDMGMLSARLDTKSQQIDAKIASIKDGEDADEEKIVQDVLAQIKIPEVRAPIMDGPEEIRDKLETLQGKERMKIEAIDQLREELDELKKIRQSLGSSRFFGPSVIQKFLNNITPVGTIDGTNAEFTLPKAPKTDGEKIFLNGVRMRSGSSNDYTIAGKTITFVSAPLTGSIILVDIEY